MMLAKDNYKIILNFFSGAVHIFIKSEIIFSTIVLLQFLLGTDVHVLLYFV